jgi:hypothetical protein
MWPKNSCTGGVTEVQYVKQATDAEKGPTLTSSEVDLTQFFSAPALRCSQQKLTNKDGRQRLVKP